MTTPTIRALLAALALAATAGCTNLDPFESGDVLSPAAPVSLMAVPAGPTTIGLTWAASPGDTLASEYRVFRNGIAVVTVDGNTHTDAGLSPSTTYTYWVAAIDAAGRASSPSQPAIATTLAEGQTDTVPPTAPTSLTAVPASASAISLNWTAAFDAAGVLGYRVYRGGVEVGRASGTSYTDTGLSAGTSYTYTVTAFDAAGHASAPSNPATATTLAAGQSDTQAPSAPATLSATATSATTAALNWSASTDNVGVLGYRILRNGAQVGTASGTSYADNGLTPSTSYSYTVVAYDAAGNVSGTSPSAIVTTPAGSQPDTQAPSAPPSLTATATGTNSVDLSWSAATDNVGVTGYRVLRNGSQIGTATGTTYVDAVGLSPSTTYTYTVVAYDAAGNVSPASAPSSATTFAPAGDTQAPTTPTGLTATATSMTTIGLSWTASTDNVGVAGYRVFRNGSLLTTLTGTGTTFNDTGLTAATTYSYSVVAFDAVGNSSLPSAPASATTPDTQAPTAPASLNTAALNASSISLTWSPSTDNVGVTQYRIFRNGIQVGTASGTSYTDTGLSPLTTYTYTVRAADAAGNVSGPSPEATATTLLGG